MITKSDFDDLGKVIEKAREDSTPYAVYDGKSEQLSVYGDANKTENKSVDMTVLFRFLKEDFEQPDDIADTKEIGKYVQYSRTYTDVAITPRKNTEVLEHLLSVVPYFTEIEDAMSDFKEAMEKAETKEQKSEVYRAYNIKVLHVYNTMSDDVTIALYNFVATLCGISDEEAAHMVASSVMTAASTIITEFPEVLNEAETLFGY